MIQDDVTRLLRRLSGRRSLARLAILFERVWPVLWPPLGVAGVFLCLALLEVPQTLPIWAHVALLTATTVGVLGLLARGLRSIRAPSDSQADRRLELASGLSHRPLSVLTDRPSGDDAGSVALWQAHVARAVTQIRSIRVGLPRPGLAQRDPRALRGALMVALVAAFVIAGQDAPSRIAAAMEPALPRAAGAPATEVQAWITPPAYTKVAPLFLKPEGGAVTAPTGSHFTVSVTGGSGTPSLSADGHAGSFNALDQNSFQADRDLTQGGRLAVRRNGRELTGWDVTVVADQAPHVSWAEPPGRASAGQETRLPWQVSDDYGVTGLQAELRLDARPNAAPLIITIPLPGGSPKSAHGTSQQDLTANPWAGLPVTATLRAHDASNQTGTSAPAKFELPERPFHNEIARALIEIRKTLSIHPGDRSDAVAGLDVLLMAPQAFGQDAGAFINLSALYYLLIFDKTPQAVETAQSQLWELALHMEEGQTERTERDLDAARQAAKEALDKALKDPNDANRAALDKRLQELEAAIERHMQAMLEEAKRSQDAMPLDPDAQKFSNRDLERMAERAREAARQGKMDDAQQRMAELEKMLDQLRNARTEHGQNDQHAGQRQRGRQQMGALQDMIGRQGGLLDHAQGRSDQPARPPNVGEAPAQPTDQAAERDADRRIQQALRSALGELMQQFGDLTGEVPKSLGEADQAMREAGRQLSQGQDKAAGDAERQAIEALQKGGQAMGQAMAKQFGQGQPGEDGDSDDGSQDGGLGLSLQDGHGDDRGGTPLPGSPGRADARGRDPLGRRYNQGSSEAGDVTVPEERERQRTQAIEEELRRRGAQRERPKEELDYIDRLLKQF
jgi:uncharacterized protein (TIGR02302 family)